MPLTATHPAARAQWLERNAIPKASKLGNEPIKFMPMCEVLGVSRNTLKKWLTNDVPGIEESGVYRGGEQGVPYAFKPKDTVDFVIAHFRREADARAAKSAALVKTIAGDVGASPPSLTLVEIRQALDVKERMNKLRTQQGELIHQARVDDAVAAMVDEMLKAQAGALSEHDPTGQWPPEMAQAFEEALETIMLRTQKAGERCLSDLRAGKPLS